MAKKSKSKTSSKKNVKFAKATIEELQASRDGGQIALLGFTYQYLYSCYLILTQMDNTTTFYLEGVEDVDLIKCLSSADISTHIQLKYSSGRQDASFLKDVLKNFLETYLIDKHRSFKLVYDFSVAKGYLSNLIDGTTNEETLLYWNNVVTQIKNDNPHWNWNDFSFNDFLSRLSFENKSKDSLEMGIESELVRSYDISTDNITLFANSLKYCCLESMTQRKGIGKHDLDNLIQSVKEDIAKGAFNPALGWIKKIDFTPNDSKSDVSYYEGKKATPQDIANGLPVRRLQLEQSVINSIYKKDVTVIKASSGQGKTTLALQTCFALRYEYTVYQLRWCSDTKELDHILQFFKSRIKLGEKPIILLDNLDAQLSEWNRLAQLFQEEIYSHYKFLITTRETDWYNYGNDISNIKSMEVIKLALSEADALEIFNKLKGAEKLHPSVQAWRKAWTQVSDKKLLIEYVYLLTHGEMLSDRISYQISQIGSAANGSIICELLRLVCFADICGVRLPLRKIITNLAPKSSCAISELLKSIENEFLIRIDDEGKFIEGLHPVRSKHIVTSLHEFYEIDDTALQVLSMCEREYLPKLFSCLPHYISSKNKFYTNVVDVFWNPSDLSIYTQGLRGLFSGSVIQYWCQQKASFDDANIHGGLFLLSSELSPFTRVDEFNVSIDTLDSMRNTLPDDENIKYLWMDVTGSGIKGSGLAIAQEISNRIKFELGITVSIGVSFNKIFAKLGSDYKKPDAITVISKENYKDIVWPLPAGDLLYVGRSTQKKLNSIGIHSIGDLANMPQDILHSIFGKWGDVLYCFANGLDTTPVAQFSNQPTIKSIGNSTTAPRDLENNDDVKIILFVLADSVARRLREQGFKARVVCISVRDNELCCFTRQHVMKQYTNITSEIANQGMELFRSNYRWYKPIRSIGISVTDLVSDTIATQTDLFTDERTRERKERLDSTTDWLKRRFGTFSVQPAILLSDQKLSGFDPKKDHTIHPVGYF